MQMWNFLENGELYHYYRKLHSSTVGITFLGIHKSKRKFDLDGYNSNQGLKGTLLLIGFDLITSFNIISYIH